MGTLVQPPSFRTERLLSRLRAFCFPAGEQSVALIRAVKTTETGQLRMSPAAPWIPFAADQEIDSTRSQFHWEARLHPGKLTAVTVTDAYEAGHGWLTVKVAGGLIPVKKMTGPEVDKAELQRYLASLVLCPTMLLNHSSVECLAIGPSTLRLYDRLDASTFVELDVSEQGCPLACRANRPRIIGKQVLATEWSATGWDFHACEGMRVPRQLKAAWHLPGGVFPYFQCEITSFRIIR